MPSYGEDSSYQSTKRKRIALISVSSLILVAMVVAVTVGVNQNGQADEVSRIEDGEIHSSIKAIKAICQPTDFKKTCIDSLSKAAGNTTDPKELIKVAFKVAMKHLNDAAEKSVTLQALEKDPRGHLALQSCKELMDSSIDDLNKAVDQIGTFDVSEIDDILADTKIWLSAAINYQETCLDGFQNTTGTAGEKMRKALNSTSELTRNALAMVSEVSSVLSSLDIPLFNRRRLLSDESSNYPIETNYNDGFPSWVSDGKRRLLQTAAAHIKADMVVAKDGSGNYRTINEALLEVPKKSNLTFVLYIKEGIYDEYVIVNKSITYLMMIGDGPTKTKITGNKNFIDGTPTFRTASAAILGDGFIAKDIGFENTAGPEKHQAVALRVQSDMSIFYNCQMDAYQDTLYAHTKRQFYRDCTISGTIDFIFGDAAVVFQNCKMVVRKPLDNQQCIVTAQGRKDPREPTGIVLQGCTIVADPSLFPFKATIRSYLGRPWKLFSKTIIMQSKIGNLIHPDGWLPWVGDYALDTLFYSEFQNVGPGAPTTMRVKWPGIKTLKAEEYEAFTPAKFLDGNSWIAPARVPYTSGMMITTSRKMSEEEEE